MRAQSQSGAVRQPVDLDAAAARAFEDATKLPDAGNIVTKGDPAQTVEELAGARTNRLVDDITDAPIAEIRQLRDQLDDTARALQRRRDMIKSMIQEQVEFARKAIEVKIIVADAIRQLSSSIEEGLTPALGKTITGTTANGKARSNAQ